MGLYTSGNLGLRVMIVIPMYTFAILLRLLNF